MPARQGVLSRRWPVPAITWNGRSRGSRAGAAPPRSRHVRDLSPRLRRRRAALPPAGRRARARRRRLRRRLHAVHAMIERRPRLVAECLAADDVVADIGVAPPRRVARVGGGVIWAAVDGATQTHGLATTGGRVSTTGVAGLTLGGGSGWLERAHGLACDNLLAAELVTWDGRIVRATEGENADLLWALRGGGGSFGVVTALELALHPLGPDVWAGLALFGIDRAHEVLRTFRDVMNAAPEALSLACAFITASEDDGDVPAHLRGRPAVAILGVWAGDVADGERALAPVRALDPDADLFGPMPYADFQCSVDDPPGYRNHLTAESNANLPDEAINALVRRAAELPPGPSQLFIVAWGGAVRRFGPEHSPLAGREARFIVHPLLLWEDPADDERNRTLARAFRSDLRPWSSGATYPNFLGEEGGARMRAAFGASAERLAAVKAQWDPHGVFRTHQAIRAAAARAGAVRLPVIARGDADGVPLVLLHGLSDSGPSFEPLLAHLPPSIRALAVTLRGHGDAPKPAGGYGVEQLAADVVRVLDDAGVEGAVVAGHSMGSIVATRLALDAPERVAGLVLMGAKPTYDDRALDDLYSLFAGLEDPVDPAFVREFQESTLARPVPPGLLDAVVAESLKLPARVWHALIGPTLCADHSAELGRIAAPALVAWGDRDEIALRADQDALVEAIPGARLVVYEGGGHAFHWEDPAAFAGDLVAFVDEVVA